jgi:hypothetical protein
MPRVPQADLPSIGLQTGAMPQFQASQVAPAQNFMGQQLQQLGQGVEQLGAGMYRMGDRINDARARAADNELSEFNRAALTQYRNLQGKDAVQARDKFVQDMEQKRKELADSLDNEWQRGSFEQRAAYRSLQFNTYVDDHYQGQATAFEIGEASASLKANVQDFSEQYKSAKTMPVGSVADNTYFKDALRQVDVIAAAKGIPADSAQYRLMREEAEDSLHISAMLTMADGQDPMSRNMARSYYAQNKERISLPNRQKIEAQLRTMDVDDDAFALSRELRSYSQGLGNQMEMLDQLRMIGDIDGQVYNATAQKLQSAFNSQEAARKETQVRLQDAYEQSLTQAIQNGTDWTSWLSSNNNLVDQLNSQGMLRDAETFFAERGRKNTREGLDLLSNYMMDPTPLRGMKWTDVRAKMGRLLDNEHLDKLEKLYATSNGLEVGPSNRKTSTLVEFVSEDDFRKQMVAEIFGEPFDAKWGLSDASAEDKAKRDRWTKTAAVLESRMQADKIPGNDRQAIKDWVKNYKAREARLPVMVPSISGTPLNQINLDVAWPTMTEDQKMSVAYQYTADNGHTVSMTMHDWVNDPAKRAQAIKDASDYAGELEARGETQADKDTAEVLKQLVRTAKPEGDIANADIIYAHLRAEAKRGQMRAAEQAKEDATRRAGIQAVRDGLAKTQYDLPSWVRMHLPQDKIVEDQRVYFAPQPVEMQAVLNEVDVLVDIAIEQKVFGSAFDPNNPSSKAEARRLMQRAIMDAAEPKKMTGGALGQIREQPMMMLPPIPEAKFNTDQAARSLQASEAAIREYVVTSGVYKEYTSAGVRGNNAWVLAKSLIKDAVDAGLLSDDVSKSLMEDKSYRGFRSWLYGTIADESIKQWRNDQTSEAKQKRAQSAEAFKKQKAANDAATSQMLKESFESMRAVRTPKVK